MLTDIVDVHVFRQRVGGTADGDVEFLQMRRSHGALSGTWQPVIGHVVGDETAVETARRELEEETGFVARAEDAEPSAMTGH